MKILVTGSKGQLGSEINKLSQDYGQSAFTFIDISELDLTDEKNVSIFFQDHSFDVVVNCAAYTAVDKAEQDSELAQKVNYGVPLTLAKLSNTHNFSLVHISTDFVFDGKKTIPYSESDKTQPLSVYGKTKCDGEVAITENAKSAIMIRTSWLYSRLGSNFVKNISALAIDRNELNIVADQHGTPTYAHNLAKAIIKIIHHENFLKACKSKEIFHFSDQGVTSWYHFTLEILKLQNIKCVLTPITTAQYPTPATRPQYSVLNCNKISKWFDITLPHWRSSLKQMLKG